MSSEVIDVKQLPKETIAKFVNDAARMETEIYSLRETATKLKQNTSLQKKETEDHLNLLAHNLEFQEEIYHRAEKEANNFSATKKSISIFCKSILALFIGTLLFAVIFDILHSSFNIEFDALINLFSTPLGINIHEGYGLAVIEVIIGLSVNIILWVCFVPIIIIGCVKESKRNNDTNVQTNKAKLNICQTEYNQYSIIFNEKQKTLVALSNHAEYLEQSAAEIDAALQKHYSLGIIPTDYRDMIRVLYIDRAFRNDQVDTIREATLLCDRDIQHSEVMKGLHEIASAINSLAPVLDDISHKITLMHDELKSIADGQDKLISEAESTRYATKAVQKSQESILWYEQQKWYRANH